MAQTIRLKRSAVAAKAPLTTDLALGELAINTFDGKMYFKKNVSGTDSIITLANDNEVVKLTGTQSIAGLKTFTNNLTINAGTGQTSLSVGPLSGNRWSGFLYDHSTSAGNVLANEGVFNSLILNRFVSTTSAKGNIYFWTAAAATNGGGDIVFAADPSTNTPRAGIYGSIQNLKVPTTDYEAANKKYVDDQDALKANTSHTHAASDITSGTIATARLGSGTADSTTFLRGDNTWAAVSGSGTVTSVAFSTGTTGLSVTGSPITSSGTITLAGTLAIANGGTGATSAGTALTNLGAAADSEVVKLTGDQTIAGNKTFSGTGSAPYGSTRFYTGINTYPPGTSFSLFAAQGIQTQQIWLGTGTTTYSLLNESSIFTTGKMSQNGSPSNNTDLVPLGYLNTQLATKANDDAVVKLTGTQTIGGNKTFSGAGTTLSLDNPNVIFGTSTFVTIQTEATVRSLNIQGLGTTSHRHINFLTPSTNTNGGIIRFGTDASGNLQTTPKGAIQNLGTPVNNNDAANKQYVDDQDALKANVSHTHGNITNAGAIGSTANLPIITTTSGVLTTGSFGTTANTFAEGNHTHTLDNLSDVVITSATTGQVLKYNGTNWVNDTDATGGGGGISDGDKGDITVSSSGATWTIDNAVVTYAKIQNVSTNNRLLGRVTAGAGSTEEITIGSGLSLTGSTLEATASASVPDFIFMNLGVV